MEDFSTLTRDQLIDELRRLRSSVPDAGDGNGKFDEDELFDLAKGVNGDQLFWSPTPGASSTSTTV